MKSQGVQSKSGRTQNEEGGLLHVIGGLYFYRGGMRLMTKALLISMSVNVFLAILIGALYFKLKNTEPVYFATTPDGRLIKMTPLREPMVSSNIILSFVAQAIQSLYAYDFANYRQQIQSNETYFTEGGWASYLKALNDSRVLDMVREQKLTVSSIPRGPAVLVDEGIVNGRHAWKVRIPIQVHYQTSGKSSSRNIMITVTVLRTDITVRERGYAISQIIESEE